MNCSNCDRELREIDDGGLHLDVCDCGSIWFDRGELEARMADANPVRRAGELVLRDADRLRCPPCATPTLQRFELGEIRGSRCTTCRGVWLTKIEVERLRAITGHAEPGDSPTGAAGPIVADGIVHFLIGILDGL